ncbi:hypothetical protein LTR78_009451 [Recurvomyces mirabilis]|uniref:Uncharacterized protein n=1 Tax=Recurvomyces mirabilis TaxID=574656 RepID=A0AAE0TRH5_9PEZI|nr:hypothetical protein LTR78_009451 [Recurvomyces mirabilis]KAK5152356.1 hypothetical protein LTS14_008303 [Recurvomyces mirabilis]
MYLDAACQSPIMTLGWADSDHLSQAKVAQYKQMGSFQCAVAISVAPGPERSFDRREHDGQGLRLARQNWPLPTPNPLYAESNDPPTSDEKIKRQVDSTIAAQETVATGPNFMPWVVDIPPWDISHDSVSQSDDEETLATLTDEDPPAFWPPQSAELRPQDAIKTRDANKCPYKATTRAHGTQCFDKLPKQFPADTIKLCVNFGPSWHCSSDPKNWLDLPYERDQLHNGVGDARKSGWCSHGITTRDQKPVGDADPQPFGWYAANVAGVGSVETRAEGSVMQDGPDADSTWQPDDDDVGPMDSNGDPNTHPEPLLGDDDLGLIDIKRDDPYGNSTLQPLHDSPHSAMTADDPTITPRSTMAESGTSYDYNTVPVSIRGPRWSEYSMGISMGRISSTMPPPVEGPVWRSYSAYTASLASASEAAKATPRGVSPATTAEDLYDPPTDDVETAYNASSDATTMLNSPDPLTPRKPPIWTGPKQVCTPTGGGQICTPVGPLVPPALSENQKHPAATTRARRKAVPPGVIPMWPPTTPTLVSKRRTDKEMPLVPVPFIV